MIAVKGYHTKWPVPDAHRESAEYIEAGAVTPTLALLHRFAGALEGELNLKITGASTHAEFPLAS